jgi:hypothetical protein
MPNAFISRVRLDMRDAERNIVRCMFPPSPREPVACGSRISYYAERVLSAITRSLLQLNVWQLPSFSPSATRSRIVQQ